MKNIIRNIFITIAGIFLIIDTAISQTVEQLSFFAPLPSIFEMDYSNDHLFITQQGLKVMDVSDPQDPEIVGSAAYFGSYAYQIAVEGNYVYMASGGNGAFAIYDVSDVSNPMLTGFVNIPATSFSGAGDIAPHGNYVYLAGYDTLYVINVSDVADPQVESRIGLTDILFSGAGEMEIDDNSLFMQMASSFQVFDITDAANPEFITSVPNTHAYQKGLSIDTSGKRLFLQWLTALQQFMGYDAFDISDPSAPVFLFADSTSFGGGDYGISAYWNNILYISKGGGMNVFRVTNVDHEYLTTFTGQSVANASVSIEVRDSVFYNARISGVEILELNGGIPTQVADPSDSKNTVEIYPSLISENSSELNLLPGQPMADGSIEILNSAGTRCYLINHLKLKAGEVHKISLIELPAGIYFITVKDQQDNFSSKIVIE